LLVSASGCAYTLRYNLAKVSRNVDGDTIVLTSGERVRYLCIDTPEIHHPRKPLQPFGLEASARNAELTSSKSVVLEYDRQRRDWYGRLLAMTYSSGVLVNAELLKEGYARLMVIRPNQSCRARFALLQDQARADRSGLWSISPDRADNSK